MTDSPLSSSIPKTPPILDFQKEFNEDGTPFTAQDYVSWVIGTTIDWTLHPDRRRHDTQQLAERRLLGLIALLESGRPYV